MEFSRGQGADHRGRRAAQGQDGADQAAGRRGHRRPGGHDRRRPAGRQRRADEGRARPLVPRAARAGGRRVPAGADGRRGPAVHPLHVAARPPSRRASCTPPAATSPASPTPTRRSSTSSPRRTCTGARPTSAGSPGTPTSSTGRWPTARPRSCTRARRTIPDKDIWWDDRRALQGQHPLLRADRHPRVHEVGRQAPGEARPVSSLRLLGTVGEPINPKAWLWYWKVIGGGRCPIVDTWWQTETGAIMITTLPGLLDAKPGSAGRPLPGIEASVVTEEGEDAGTEQGYLTLRAPLAGDAAHALQGGRALHRDLLGQVRPGHLPRGRRRAPGRGRLLLDHRAHRRRGERLRPPPVHGRGRVGDRLALEGRRGRGDRPVRRGHRPGDHGVRDPGGRPRGRRRPRGGDPRARGRPDRQVRAARSGSSGPTTCRRRARARSCAGCCATSPRAASWAT